MNYRENTSILILSGPHLITVDDSFQPGDPSFLIAIFEDYYRVKLVIPNSNKVVSIYSNFLYLDDHITGHNYKRLMIYYFGDPDLQSITTTMIENSDYAFLLNDSIKSYKLLDTRKMKLVL